MYVQTFINIFCTSGKCLIMPFQQQYFKESSICLLELTLLSRHLMSLPRILDLSDLSFLNLHIQRSGP